MTVATCRAQAAIEEMLNNMQSVASPGTYKQKELMREGEDPVYLRAEESYENLAVPAPDDLRIREMFDAFAEIQPEDDLDVELMSPENWERGHQELADLLGVGVGTIHRRRARLYEKYLELME